jgi:glutathione synthase/RimK-type ligase-like ATP-grasp enzyme
MAAHPTFMFIAKPNGGKGGEGIQLIQKFKDLPRDTQKNELREFLVQRYIKTPLLLDNKKFDLRLYVLITGFNPVKAYLADEGLARLCTEDYK